MRVISNQERRARLAVRHRLADPAADPVEATRSMVGLHSSDPATVYLSVWARVPGFEPDDLQTALYEDKALVRILGMRRTLWVVPRGFASVVNSSSTVALLERELRRTAKMVEDQNIASDGASWVKKTSAAVLAALRSMDEATARELTKEVPQLGTKVTFYKKDGTVLGEVGMSTRILFLLATAGRVIRARPLGSWVSSQYRWSTTENWIGGHLEDLDRGQAQAEALRAWLLSFGPGTELDIKWWTGWPVTQVRKALAAVGAVEVELEDGTGWVLEDDIDPVAPTESWVGLLPSLDPTVMGWKERNWYLGGHSGQLFDRNGNAGPTVWLDGRVVGGWAQRKEGDVAHELFEDVGNEAASAVETKVAALQDWLGDTRVTPRFRSPHDKKLCA